MPGVTPGNHNQELNLEKPWEGQEVGEKYKDPASKNELGRIVYPSIPRFMPPHITPASSQNQLAQRLTITMKGSIAKRTSGMIISRKFYVVYRIKMRLDDTTFDMPWWKVKES